MALCSVTDTSRLCWNATAFATAAEARVPSSATSARSSSV
jgi:hypothetical protein